MTDQVRVGLVFSRSGQQLFVHVSRDMAHKTKSLTPKQLMALEAQIQRDSKDTSVNEAC